MELNIRLFTGLICDNPDLPCHGQSRFLLAVPEGTTVRALRDMLGINPNLPLLTLVNNCSEPEERELKDGDKIGMFPPIGGG